MSARDWGDDVGPVPRSLSPGMGHRLFRLGCRIVDPSGDALVSTYGPNPDDRSARERMAFAGAIFVVLTVRPSSLN